MTDSELLNDYVSKCDEHAFAEIVLRYERLVWSVCHHLLINHNDREDAFQNTFLILASSAHRIRKPDSISNWLHSVAWKTASRIRKRRAIVSLNEYIENGNQVPAPTETQLDRIARLNEFELVNRQLQAMPEKHRTPLVLFYFAGLSAKQISLQLNLTVAATEGRLRRARKKLRGRLQSRSRDNQFGESNSASSAALLVLLTSSLKFESCPGLIASTVETSLATTASVSVGVTSGVLNTGTKLMICKYACAAGVSAILALGGLMHSSAFQETGQVKTAQIQIESTEAKPKTGGARILVEPAIPGKVVVDKVPVLGDVPIVGRLFTRYTKNTAIDKHVRVRALHARAFHHHAVKHVKQICDLIGCICWEEEAPKK